MASSRRSFANQQAPENPSLYVSTRSETALAIKLGPKAGCSLEALNFRIPSRVFLYWGREFPGLQLSHGEPGPIASYQRYSRGNAPFSPSKITYLIENHRVKKTEIVTLYGGKPPKPVAGQRLRTLEPPPGFLPHPVFPARCRSLGVCSRRLS